MSEQQPERTHRIQFVGMCNTKGCALLQMYKVYSEKGELLGSFCKMCSLKIVDERNKGLG